MKKKRTMVFLVVGLIISVTLWEIFSKDYSNVFEEMYKSISSIWGDRHFPESVKCHGQEGGVECKFKEVKEETFSKVVYHMTTTRGKRSLYSENVFNGSSSRILNKPISYKGENLYLEYYLNIQYSLDEYTLMLNLNGISLNLKEFNKSGSETYSDKYNGNKAKDILDEVGFDISGYDDFSYEMLYDDILFNWFETRTKKSKFDYLNLGEVTYANEETRLFFENAKEWYESNRLE